jgi:hypothetical protein
MSRETPGVKRKQSILPKDANDRKQRGDDNTIVNAKARGCADNTSMNSKSSERHPLKRLHWENWRRPVNLLHWTNLHITSNTRWYVLMWKLPTLAVFVTGTRSMTRSNPSKI